MAISFQEYERTGYVWEQYDALTGEGRRRWVVSCSDTRACLFLHFLPSHPFTGWTSLVSLSECLFDKIYAENLMSCTVIAEKY